MVISGQFAICVKDLRIPSFVDCVSFTSTATLDIALSCHGLEVPIVFSSEPDLK